MIEEVHLEEINHAYLRKTMRIAGEVLSTTQAPFEIGIYKKPHEDTLIYEDGRVEPAPFKIPPEFILNN